MIYREDLTEEQTWQTKTLIMERKQNVEKESGDESHRVDIEEPRGGQDEERRPQFTQSSHHHTEAFELFVANQSITKAES